MLFQVLITSPLEISVQISHRLILQISRLLWGSFISYLHSHNLPQENFQKWSKEISLQELKLSKALHSLQSKCLYNHSKFLLILRGNCVPSGFHDFSHCSLNLNCPRINFILEKTLVRTHSLNKYHFVNITSLLSQGDLFWVLKGLTRGFITKIVITKTNASIIGMHYPFPFPFLDFQIYIFPLIPSSVSRKSKLISLSEWMFCLESISKSFLAEILLSFQVNRLLISWKQIYPITYIFPFLLLIWWEFLIRFF